jgi:hypothetical protein
VRTRLGVILLCLHFLSLGASTAGEIRYEMPNGSVYVVTTSDTGLDILTESQRADFEKKRTKALNEVVGFLHASRWGIRANQWTGRQFRRARAWAWWLVSPVVLPAVSFFQSKANPQSGEGLVENSVVSQELAPPEEPKPADVRRIVEAGAQALDKFLVAHAPLVSASNMRRFQFSIGVVYGAAVHRYGSARGAWLTLHLDRTSEGESKRRLTLDRENLVTAIPCVLTGALVVKIVYAFGADTGEPSQGKSIYPILLPLTEITSDSVGVGYSKALFFFPPAPYLMYLENELKRSRPLSIRNSGKLAKDLGLLCRDTLLSLIRR